MNLRELANNANSFDFNKNVNEVIDNNANLIVSMNQEQLLEGKNSEGKDLRPYYSEDPYFKTRAAALRYAEWKKRITPNSFRKTDVPNLYINGFYHSSFQFKRTGDKFEVTSGGSLSGKIEPKYEHIHTLTPENCISLSNEKIVPFVITNYNKTLTK
jgi:hypothetical protein